MSTVYYLVEHFHYLKLKMTQEELITMFHIYVMETILWSTMARIHIHNLMSIHIQHEGKYLIS